MMERFLELINLAFCILLLTWVLLDWLKRRRDIVNVHPSASLDENPHFLIKIAPFCCATIFIFYMGFGFYEFWYHQILLVKSILLDFTWFLASLVAAYSSKKVFVVEKKWPLVLSLWWVYSTLIYLIMITTYSITHFTSISLRVPFPKPSLVDVFACPFSILLCLSSLIINPRENHDLRQPLLEAREETDGCFSKAGFLSQLTFSWLNTFFKAGNLQRLDLHHIPSVPQSETAEIASYLLEEALQKQKVGTYDLSLTHAIFYSVWRSLALNAVFAGANVSASYMGPLLITSFVNYLSNKEDDTSYHYGLILASLFFIAKSIESLSQRQWYFGANRIGTRVRAALMVLVYKKSLSIKSAGPGNGKIINFIDVDAERIGDFFLVIHRVWLLPLQIFFALLILYKNLGAAPSFAAFFATVLVMVCNTPLANRQETLHSKIMEAKDARMKATLETLKSMRVLKLHSWESSFLNKLLGLRETERKWLSKYLYMCSAVAFLFWASPTLVSVLTFGVCILVKTPLTSSTVLSAIATFRILQEPIYNLPELISMMAQTKVSVDRIQGYIMDEDQKKQIAYHKFKGSNVVVDVETGEYSWEGSYNLVKPSIRISERIRIKKGEKVAICGSVGSGKSSLICSILDEIPRISGSKIKVLGTKAYVPQSAWIQTGSVRENILFGKEMNKALYEEVLEGCALNKDVEMWANGDLCGIGERGMNLSGGQKQRIQLARAVYSDSDVYFLDDPFSAVDAHTGAHLFKRCLMQLLSQKTVIYVTHQLESLDAADLILVMLDGKIVQSGRYEDLIKDANGELVRLMAAHKSSLAQVNTHQEHNLSTKCCTKDSQSEAIEEAFHYLINTDNLSNQSNDNDSESGCVNSHIYWTFVRAAYGGALVPVILLCQVLFQGLQIGSNYWIAWATQKEEHVTKMQLIGIFVMLSGGSSLFILGRTVFLSKIAITTAQKLYLDMITSVFRAPISFFDSTPSSKILNRSSTDQSIVDTDIPYRLAGLAFALIQLLSVIVLMCHVAWQVFPLFVTIIVISVWYQAYYRTTARELARMVGILKAPILHHLSETITGVSTIRCFNQEHRFYTKIHSLVDDYTRVCFHNSATMEWLSVRINFLFNLAFLIVLVVLVTLPRSAIDPSLSGLAATYGLNLNVLQAWVIWNLCNVENKMISVERILQLTRVPSEAPEVIEDCRPEIEWPSQGLIEFNNLHVQYSPSLPMVLKEITCVMPGGKKIGVVGRTGSGKSTLIQALFRVVEPTVGRVLIDGVDICQMGLQDLRSRLSIIPQDPTLFQDTLRANLDPLHEHSDEEIWQVLEKCCLGEVVKQDKRLLEAPVAEDGENWSLGQRQLVCLARVLLQKRRVLVLDEATASVDMVTDNLIQTTIRNQTSGCTVITVAHRIPTVVDNDLVMVLDQGKIIEYDSPSELLRDGSSAFSKLVMEYMNRSCRR